MWLMPIGHHLASLLLFDLAKASSAPNTSPHTATCMTTAEAHQVASLWTQLIGNYSSAFALATLVPNFTDYSDSALSLNSECQLVPGTPPPLLSPVFSDRTAFMEGQGSQPPIASTILQVWNSCDQVTMRYDMTNIGTGSRPVVGVISIETVKGSTEEYPWLLETIYSEFDVGAWVENLKDAGDC